MALPAEKMPLKNMANLPLDAKTVADSVTQALDTSILPKTARYIGLMIFCEAENAYYSFTKHDDGTEKCVACFMCATACPAECIFIEAEERFDGVDEKRPKEFKIDLLECVFCGYCVEACPCDAIRMDTGIFSFTASTREEFVLDKKALMKNERSKDFE